MDTVGIRELKQKTTQILRRVREKQEKIQISYRGEVIALLVPVEPKKRRARAAAADDAWADLDQLAAEIGAQWPQGVTAVDALSEDRR